MSSLPGVRRVDRLMAEDTAREFLKAGFAANLATVSEDGSPYCVPFLYVWMDDRLFSTTRSLADTCAPMWITSHESASLSMNRNRFSTMADLNAIRGLAYRSVIVFGRIEIVADLAVKQRFFESLMEKYGTPDRD